VLIASRLGEGAVSVLGYANRLLALFSGLASVVVTRALMPVLSASHLRSPAVTRALVRAWVQRSIAAGLMLGLLVALVAEVLTRLLFERGQFTAADTARVAGVLRFAATQLPVLLPSLVLAAYAMAMRRYRLLVWTGISTVVCVPVAGWLLSGWMGLQGLVLAPTLSLCITTALLLAGLRASAEHKP
jgi:putative peptidoglycan lipid II flippase